MKGVIRTPHDLAPLADFKAQLRCDLHTSMRAAHGGRSSGTDCLREAFQSMPATTRPSGGIPIEIAIPDNGAASGTRKSPSDTTVCVTWSPEFRALRHGLELLRRISAHRWCSRRRTVYRIHGTAVPVGEDIFIPFLIAGTLLSAASAYTTWDEVGLVLLLLAWVWAPPRKPR